MSKLKRKLLSLVMIAAMVTTLFAGLTISASAYTATGTMTTLYNSGNSASTGTYYSISTPTELGYLSSYVNAGKNSTGVTFYLTNNIDLQNNSWTPIGYHGRPFNGTFDGDGYAVYNLYINTSTGTHKGLFGSIGSTGVVKNVGVTGSITAYRYEGGITGYNEGTIEYCYNMASVTGDDSGTRGAGGIAGVNAGIIRSCYNRGSIYNSYRPAGGIAGIFDPDVASGVASISNCYNAGNVSSASGSGWAGAIVATLNNGSVTDCYYEIGTATYGIAYPSSATGTTPLTHTQMLDGTLLSYLNGNPSTGIWKEVEGSYPTLTIDKNNMTVIIMSSLPTKTVYKVGEPFSETGMVIETASGTQITNYTVSKTTALAMTDTSITISGNHNGNAFSFNIPIDVYSYLPNATTVYLDGTASTNGTGTSGSPLNNLRDAINAATYNGSNGNPLGITVSGTITISGTETYNPNNITFTRASNTVDPMFNVNAGSGNTVIFTSAILDGNGSGTIFNVTSGELITRGGIVLRNCATGVNVNGGLLTAYYATIAGTTNSISLNNGTLTIDEYYSNKPTSITGPISIVSGTGTMNGGTISGYTTTTGNGGGLNLSGGTFTMTGGTISGNTAVNGGGVYIGAGTFAMSGGTIGGTATGAGNSATYGGGVYVANSGTFTMSDGTISGDTAVNGGGVYIANGGTFTMTGGTITGNTATTAGAGVYFASGGVFNLGCSGIASTNEIYLANTTVTNCSITLTAALSSDITVRCANPTIGTYTTGTRIATGSNSTSIITSTTLSHILYPGYTLSRRTTSPICIYISGVAS